jgi:hypothetical protein
MFTFPPVLLLEQFVELPLQRPFAAHEPCLLIVDPVFQHENFMFGSLRAAAFSSRSLHHDRSKLSPAT